MKDFFRTLFGIRTKRRAPPITSLPQVGASIVRHGYKIKLTQPCRPDLWDWLLLSGWRATPVVHDRRAYILLPEDTIIRLNPATQEEREQILRSLMSSAWHNTPTTSTRTRH